MKYTLEMIYEKNGKKYPMKALSDDTVKVDLSCKNGRLTAVMNAKEKITVKKFRIKIPYDYQSDSKLFSNGFQSWTDTKEYSINEKMDYMNPFVELYINGPFTEKTGLNRAGDSYFYKYVRKTGVFYSCSYGYVRRGNTVELFGSLSEKEGYTTIRYDVGAKALYIEKDLEGKEFCGEYKLVDLAVIKDTYENAFDKYFEMMQVKCRQKKRLCGYTTWYNYYSNINEEIVKRDLEALRAMGDAVEIFQIDDGYQQAIGDWLITDKVKFPNGMKAVADAVHSAGLKAGLWLAPFGVTSNSDVFKNHQDWLVKDKKGRPFVAGANWGKFYALDIYNEEVRAHIKNVFDVVLNRWGYDMVKLDFLYAAAIVPRSDKTRGQIMCEAMEFIRECCGEKLILGCGVPMMPSFGLVDYCRIGADVDLKWCVKKMTTREDVSTPNTVCNSAFRRHLDGRAFLNDPDVFLLRDNNLKMDLPQKKLLAQINNMFGNLLFVSDNVKDYRAEQLEIFNETMTGEKPEVLSVDITAPGIMKVVYVKGGKEDTLVFNYELGKRM